MMVGPSRRNIKLEESQLRRMNNKPIPYRCFEIKVEPIKDKPTNVNEALNCPIKEKVK